jgi:hypothetical protein
MTVMTVLSRRPVEILCRAAVVAGLCGGWGLVAAPEVAESVVATFHADASQALDAMVKEAKARNMKGVATVAFVKDSAANGTSASIARLTIDS